MIPVLAAPALDPGAQRVEMTLPEGLTLAEIVAQALPGLAPAGRAQTRVALVGPRGSSIILPAHWARVRPHPGIRVVIRLIPAGDDTFRSILSIAVSIAATALGQVWATGSILGFSGATAGAIVGLGVNLIGALLINALVPPPQEDKTRPSYTITGWQNRLTPDGAVPVLLGKVRVAPPFAAPPWTEIVGDWQYVRALLCLGEGRVEISAIRIGETAIEEFDAVEIETREGVAGDQPCSLYPRQVFEEKVGVDLTRPLPRDDLGEVVDGPAAETPVVRTTGADAAEASIILAFPAGLIRVTDAGSKRRHSVSIRIRQRLVTDEDWTPVTTLTISAKRTEGFYRQHSWAFPTRGRWQVELTMMTAETEDPAKQQRCAWAVLQTIRPEYPLAYPRPLALIGLRIKATHQLSGSLDNINVLGRRICRDWDHEAEEWVERATSNPASLYRHVLQDPSNPKAVADDGIDLDLLQAWHDHCRLQGLTYDRLLSDTGTSLRDILTGIAAAGRARPRHDGLRWGVVIDRPSDLIVDHINPRNSWGFRATRTYAELPHALVVNFADGGNDYKPAQRIVLRPGYGGDITLTEAIDMPWVTSAATAWREGLRRWYEILQRPDTYEVTQDGVARVATTGDTLALSHDVLSRTQWAGRVRDVMGRLIELDQEVEMAEGGTYAIRFRTGLDEAEVIGASTVRIVVNMPGTTRVLTVSGSGLMPGVGDLVHFGPAATESYRVVVTGIERAADNASIIRMVDAADDPVTGIDALVDAAEVPPWSSRVGTEIDPSILAPAAPRFAAITSGLSGAGAADTIAFLLEPGPGGIGAAGFEIDHRPGLSGGWTTLAIPAANGGGEITAYADGATVQLRARAMSSSGTPGAWSPVITLVVAASDLPLPAALDADAVSVTPLLGGMLIQIATGADIHASALQVYRSTTAVLDRETDAVGAPVDVSPYQTTSIALGDTTRVNLLSDPSFGSSGAWDADAGWSVAGGVAAHMPGTAGSIGQDIALTDGKWYRIGFALTGRSAGTLTPRLVGGAMVTGTAVSANGDHIRRLQATSGNAGVDWQADSAFDGSLDDAVLYAETAACLASGTHYLWIEPLNADGAPGPVTGPIAISII